MVVHQGQMVALCVAAAVVFGAPQVLADEPGTMVIIPFDGKTTGDLAGLAGKFTGIMALAARERGISVEVSQGTRTEVTSLAECMPETPECLQGMLAILEVDAIVLGRVQGASGTASAIVTVTLVQSGDEQPSEHVIALQTRAVDALLAEFSAIATSLLAGEELVAPTTPIDPVTPPIVVAPDPQPRVENDGFSFGRASGTSWIITSLGLALVGTGAAFHYSASGKLDDAKNAPRDTLDDLMRLGELDDTGKRHELIGNGLLIAGGLIALTGVTLVIVQAASSDEPGSAPTVTAMPLPGGAGVTVTWGLP